MTQSVASAGKDKAQHGCEERLKITGCYEYNKTLAVIGSGAQTPRLRLCGPQATHIKSKQACTKKK
jgi:hypothetical protein